VTWRYVEVRDRDGPLWRRMLGVWRQRQLLRRMAQRDLRQRYAGASLGTWWAVVNPLVFVGAYTLLFTVIFRARLTPDAPPSAYALYVVSGLLPWVAFTEVATRATQTVAEHRNLIKYTMFPAELLPLTGLYGAMLSQLAGSVVVATVAALVSGQFSFATAWIVPALLIEAMFLAGVAWLLGAVGAAFRDAREVIQILLTAGMFFTPIFFTVSTLPSALQGIVLLNPVAPLIEVFRAALLGAQVDLARVAAFAVFSLALAIAGFAAFDRVRSELADAL
jgi:lipopolysaccharide transport system permease protein